MGWSTLNILLGIILLTTATSRCTATAASKADDTCQTPECMTLAAGIVTMMNHSADPCHDFYDYACGNFANTVSYSPCKADRDWYLSTENSLFEDFFKQMTEKVEKRIYELLVLENRAGNSDPDIQDLYNLMRVFFSSCTEWIRRSEMWYNQEELSASFMKGIFGHLMQSIDPSNGRQISLEAIVAAMVRSGGSSLVTVRLPWSFAYEALRQNMNLKNVTRAQVNINHWKWPNDTPELYEKFVQYFQGKSITKSLSLDADRETIKSMVNKAFFNELLMNERLAMKCSINFNDATLTVAELDALSLCAFPNSSFSWTLFFEELLQAPIDSDAVIETSDIRALITGMSYFKDQPVYSDGGDSFSTHASYLILNWMISFGDFLPNELRQRWQPLKYSPGTQSRYEGGRVKGCMMWTKSLMQPIFEHMYRAAYHPNDFNNIKDLIHAIKKASTDSVKSQSWIKSKEGILDKISWIQHSIGLDSLSEQDLKEFYNSTLTAFRAIAIRPDSGNENSFGKLMSIVLCANARRNFDLMSGNSPVTIFMDVSSLDVNAYNYQESNRIVFPMAILEPPMYHQSYPGYINLGSIGSLIGHEIGHSFDETGHELNRLGAAGHFWDNETEAGFLERMDCVRSCYGNYTLYPGGPPHNSSKTIGNDMSDIIGLKAAYGALQQLKKKQKTSAGGMQKLPNLLANLDQDKLFFIRAAQNWCIKSERRALVDVFNAPYSAHSANYLRVLGMMQNSWEFARTFQCTPGQAMHPEREKCSFW